jgi:hypothetical protein
MRVGIVSVFVDYHRRGRKNRASLQPQIGPLIAALLPPEVDVEIVNETFHDVDWSRDYDLLFVSALHPDFDRARQIAHYWRRRGAKVVIGGAFASSYPDLCLPWFDAVVVGDPEATVPRLFADFCRGELATRYEGREYRASDVPTPRFDLLAGRAHHPLCFEATRGCPFTCEFCVLSGVGTRYGMRPVAAVVRDIVTGQRMLEGRVPDFKRRIVGFCDNNIGGNLGYLRELCSALTPLRIQWYGSATFNVIANRELVRDMARSGCRALFVGLESFNAEALRDMRKFQNALGKTRAALDDCRANGILVASGLLVSPLVDDPDSIMRIPRLAAESGLHMPVFLAFETPIPGTPYFHRLTQERNAAFLPGALLRDFAGYTLVVRPRRCPVDEFVDAYLAAERAIFAPLRRTAEVSSHLPGLLRRGGWFPSLIELGDLAAVWLSGKPAPGRTWIAGTDVAPPESVPFADGDFVDEHQRERVLRASHVTDDTGRALPHWCGAQPVFAPRRALKVAAGLTAS